jgi:hypothetical protein
MAQVTQNYKRSFSGSVGAGLGSVFGGSGKQYYILEHKITSRYHRAGEAQEIIVDQVEIGRDPKCQVRFDESFSTVSRRHAAIVREGDKWKLIQLSNTNPTLLNGNKVGSEWYLQNGDEIQLSIGGPKLGFIIPAGKTMGSIGLSRRLSLFGKQALRPYKWAIVLLSVLLLLAIGGGVGYSIWQKKNYDNDLANTRKTIENITSKNIDLTKLISDYRKQQVKDSIDNANRPVVVPPPAIDKLIAEAKKDVYFIITRSYIWEKEENKSYPIGEPSYGSGFLLNDGYFVTARHCVETWLFNVSEEAVTANMLVTTYPDDFKVYSVVQVYSKNGLQFTLKSSDFKINRSNDVIEQVDVDENNHPLRMRFGYPIPLKNRKAGSDRMFAQDWACARVARTSALNADYEASTSLRAGEEVHILGFPVGLGVADGNLLVEPIYNKMAVARDNLDKYGCILTSQGADHGNSGGPVFVLRNNRLVVVGIVSRLDFQTEQYNHIVPVKQIKN